MINKGILRQFMAATAGKKKSNCIGINHTYCLNARQNWLGCIFLDRQYNFIRVAL